MWMYTRLFYLFAVVFLFVSADCESYARAVLACRFGDLCVRDARFTRIPLRVWWFLLLGKNTIVAFFMLVGESALLQNIVIIKFYVAVK